MLKGAALFDVWGDWSHRASRDVDLLGLSDESAERMGPGVPGTWPGSTFAPDGH